MDDKESRTGANGAADNVHLGLQNLADLIKRQNCLLESIEVKLGVILVAVCGLVGIVLASSQ